MISIFILTTAPSCRSKPHCSRRNTGLDKFITEKYADQIAAILAEWSAGLQKSSPDLQAIEKALAPDFSGFSPQTADSRLVRSGPTLEVRQIKLSVVPHRWGEMHFSNELRSALSPFSSIETAEFQIVSIDADSMQNPMHLRTRVRYEVSRLGPPFTGAESWRMGNGLGIVQKSLRRMLRRHGDFRLRSVAGSERNT